MKAPRLNDILIKFSKGGCVNFADVLNEQPLLSNLIVFHYAAPNARHLTNGQPHYPRVVNISINSPSRSLRPLNASDRARAQVVAKLDSEFAFGRATTDGTYQLREKRLLRSRERGRGRMPQKKMARVRQDLVLLQFPDLHTYTFSRFEATYERN